MSLFLVLGAGDGFAAESQSEQEYLQDLPVVLSASRLAQPLSEAPNAMTVIDRAMIKASGFRSIVDLFRLVPGMYVGYVNGSFPIIAYHGATDEFSRRMQVLVDGRSVYLPPYSHVDWDAIPLQVDDIERIEVIRGPAAASYGANSVEGVINIISRDAGSVHGAELAVTQGGGGVSDTFAHMGKAGADVDFRATVGYRADNGFDTQVLNDSNATRLANLRLNYHPAGPDSFDFHLGFSEGVRGQGVAGRTTDPLRDSHVASNFQQATWTRARSQGEDIKLNYYHIFLSTKDPGGQSLPDGSMDSERHEVELQHTLFLGEGNRFVWGGGTRVDEANDLSHLGAHRSSHEWRLFAHDEWRATDALLLNAGAMFENDGMGHGNTSPRVSLNYHLTPRHTLRAGYSVAYRSPAFFEAYANQPQPRGYLSTGVLNSEKVVSRELGYLGEFGPPGSTLDARVYADDLSNIIFADPARVGAAPLSPDGKPYSFKNLLGLHYRGAEMTAKYHWSDEGNLALNFSRQMASCSITGSLSEPLFLSTLQSLASQCPQTVPWNSGSLLLDQQVDGGWQFSAGYYYQGLVKVLNTTQQTRMRRVDLRVARKFGAVAGVKGGEVALVVQNAFQDGYTGYSAVPQTDNVILFNRRAYLTATFQF